MLFIDYGYVRREYYLPERSDGTLMAHYRHHAHDDPLWLPGMNDLTASVDFTALAEACSHAGGEIAGYWSQAQFLLGAGLPEVFARGQAQATDMPAQLRLANEVKRLTLPEAMGERFQTMLVAKALPELHLPAGLLAADRRDRL
jgi:SAM-dependent MidA family methyltransferase